MTAFEKAKQIIIDNSAGTDEIYHGIAFLYWCDIINQEEYRTLVEIFYNKHPDY